MPCTSRSPSPMFSPLTISVLLLACSLASAEVIETVRCDTTVGPFIAEVHPSWSPNGAKRFLDLVKDGFYDNSPLFRVIPGFLVQFGISLNSTANQKWKDNIADDPHPFNVDMKKGIMAFAGYGKDSRNTQVDMKKGIMAFAGYGKDSRNTQVWVGYAGCTGLGQSPWETPFAEVVHGYENTETFYSGYGGAVDQGCLKMEGQEYVKDNFPYLSMIHQCYLTENRKQTAVDEVTQGEI
eukprot:gene12030-15132_t